MTDIVTSTAYDHGEAFITDLTAADIADSLGTPWVDEDIEVWHDDEDDRR